MEEKAPRNRITFLEVVLIIVLIAIVVIAILTLLGPAMSQPISNDIIRNL